MHTKPERRPLEFGRIKPTPVGTALPRATGRPPSSGNYRTVVYTEAQPAGRVPTLEDRDSAVACVVADAQRKLRFGPIHSDYILALALLVAWSEGHDDIDLIINRELLAEEEDA